MEWEWTTDISVKKEGKHKRNTLTNLDEAEIFNGAENSLRMEQTYTHAFQCVFRLSKYPFDTQVTLHISATLCFYRLLAFYDILQLSQLTLMN